MKVITVRNVHNAVPEGIHLLLTDPNTTRRETRAGMVRQVSGPVTTHYYNPTERVIFWEERDANPFFHFFEGLWMLAGRNDLAFLTQFVKNFGQFSDDGMTLHGAYGYRWRDHFGMDQVMTIVSGLKNNPDCRRQVLQMWDAKADLGMSGKDFPCNTQALFSINVHNQLDMTVCCRSNDAIWGAHGANAVHFSMLQEFMAAAIGVAVGGYWQISNNFHAYEKPLAKVANIAASKETVLILKTDPYSSGQVKPYPMVNIDGNEWLMELDAFLNEGMVIGIKDRFFRKVALPMMEAHSAYSNLKGEQRYRTALFLLQGVHALDWRLAAEQWIGRRYIKWQRAADDGVNYDR